MEEQDLFLVFDAGTQSIRCALIDVNGRLVDFARVPIQPYFSEQPGWAEQHAGYFWENFCTASRAVLQRNSEKLARLKGVAVTSQRGTYINLDKDGNPLRPAITWLDERYAAKSKWAPFYLEAGARAVGMFTELDRLNRKCFSNWIRQNQPEIWSQTYKYVLLSGFFHFKLTGSFVESLGNNFGYMPIDGKTFRFASKWDIIHFLFPIESDKLPDLVAQGEILGSITRQASLETGIPAGLPVVASANDKACEVLGAGCLESDTACLSFGTLATVDAITSKCVQLMDFYPPYPAAIPGYYLTEVPIVRGFWMVRWFLEEFGLNERQVAGAQGISPETLLDPLVEQVPAGSHGLVLQPFWSPFRAYCGKEGKGAVIGFSEIHSRPHLYRAILEGLMYALKDGAKLTSDKLKQPFTRLRISGGGAQSRVATQIAADVFDLPVECPAASETSALGAAIHAAIGLGYYPDYPSAIQGMTRLSRVVQPIPRNRDIYAHLYNRVYRKMYARLQPLYKELYDFASRFPEEMQ